MWLDKKQVFRGKKKFVFETFLFYITCIYNASCPTEPINIELAKASARVANFHN
jgi:hypothetical protein